MATGVEADNRLVEPLPAMDDTSRPPPTEQNKLQADSTCSGFMPGVLELAESMDEASRPPPIDLNQLPSPSLRNGFARETSQHSPTEPLEYRPSPSHKGLMLGVRVDDARIDDSAEPSASTIRSPVSQSADESVPVDQHEEQRQPSPRDVTASTLGGVVPAEAIQPSSTHPTDPTDLPVDPPPYRPRSPHYSEETDDLEGLDAEVVIEIIDRLGSSEDEDEVEYLLQCVNNRQQWVKRKEWIARYPQCAPMSDIYELCRNNQRRKRQIKKDTRSRAETRLEDALSPSSSDEEEDVFGSPNRLNKRRKRREARRDAQRKDAAIREAWNGKEDVAGGVLQSAADLDFPTFSMDLNPRSPPKRPSGGDLLNWPGLAKVVRVDELAEKREKILASFVPGNGKDFYTKGKYDCSFDMISFAKIIDRNAQERIFNHKIENILGSPPNYPDFLVIVLARTSDITNEMVEAIFPDMTLAISRECLTIHAPLALKQYEATEKLKKQ